MNKVLHKLSTLSGLLLAGMLLCAPVAAQTDEKASSGIGDAINAEFGAYRYRWGGNNYYNPDRNKAAENAVAAEPSGADTAAAEPASTIEKKTPPRARSLRSGEGRADESGGDTQ